MTTDKVEYISSKEYSDLVRELGCRVFYYREGGIVIETIDGPVIYKPDASKSPGTTDKFAVDMEKFRSKI